jgi:hypothetical protein
MSLIVFTFPLSCLAEWLTRVAAGDDVHSLHLVPVDLGDVPEVWHTGVMGFQNSAGCWLDLAIPRQLATNCHI